MVKPSHVRIRTDTYIVLRFCLPANGGSLAHVEGRIDEYLTPFLCHEVFTAACEQGASQHTLQLLLQYVAPVWNEAVCAAVRGGHLDVLRWMSELQDGRGPWQKDFKNMLRIAATHGHLDIVKWLYEQGIDWHTMWEENNSSRFAENTWLYEYCSSEALKLAAEHGHLDVVQWIYKARTDTCTTYYKPIDRAVANGHLAIAKWLYDVDGECCSWRAVDTAATNGHLEMLQWLASNRLLTCSTEAIDRAAQNGHLEVVQWLRLTQYVPFDPRALYMAANSGHFEVVKWLFENVNADFQDGRWCVIGSARIGHLQVLQWLHEHLPHVDFHGAMHAAAKTGHLEVDVDA